MAGVEEIQNALQRVISKPSEIADVSWNAWTLMAGNAPETGVAGVLLEARHDEA
ncbi:hypothetical protein D3C86_2197490 [compost metagenome]